jgi:ribosomal protein S18 acetylase RimI-like enzyme
MRSRNLVAMAEVESVPRSIEFYRKLGFEVGNTFRSRARERADVGVAVQRRRRAHDRARRAPEPLMVTHT